MAKTSGSVSESWGQVTAGRAIFTIKDFGSGELLINDSPSDDGALRISKNSDFVQVIQTSETTTYMRSTKPTGWVVVIDETPVGAGGGGGEPTIPPVDPTDPVDPPATTPLVDNQAYASQGDTLYIDGPVPLATNPTFIKAYGPDAVSINPKTGLLHWNIDAGIPDESFHVGIEARSYTHGTEEFCYIIHVGVTSDKVITCGVGGTYADYATARPNMVSGGTLIIKSGTYTDQEAWTIGRTPLGTNQYPPSGDATKFTTIMGEEPNTVIFDNADIGIDVDLYTSGQFDYNVASGLRVKGGGQFRLLGSSHPSYPNLKPRNNKLKFMISEGDVNEPFYFGRTEKTIVESCAAFGGGRYKINSFRGQDVIYRRVVGRYDRSNRVVPGDPEDPKGGIVVYTTRNAAIQNSLMVDSDQEEFISNGELVGDLGSPTTSGDVVLTLDRCAQLNSEMRMFNFDEQITSAGGVADVELNDCLFWDVRPDWSLAYSWGAAWLNNCTFGEVTPRYPVANCLVYAKTGSYFRGITDSIIHNWNAAAVPGGDEYMFRGVKIAVAVSLEHGEGGMRSVDLYGIDGNNITAFNGSAIFNPNSVGAGNEINTTSYDPKWNNDTNPQGALRYIVKPEAGNVIAGKGATLMTMKGSSDTFFGDAGFDDETGIQMWPFPFETKIRAAMKEYTYTGPTYSGSDYHNRTQQPDQTQTGDRGFCADGMDLTHYFWSYLDAKGFVPSATPPISIGVTAGDGELTLYWLPFPSNLTTNLQEYKVYDFNPNNLSMSNPRTVASNLLRTTITGLNNGFTYHFVVTAVDTVKGESGYSYHQSGIPNGTITLQPIIDVDPTHPSELLIEGNQATLTSQGQGQTSVQWYKNGVAILGAISVNYTWTLAPSDNGANYHVVYTNGVGSDTSATVQLTVVPVDTTPPTVTVEIINNNVTANVTVNDNQTAQPILQLYIDDVAVGATQTSPSFNLTQYELPSGNHNVHVTALDEQNNLGTSNTVVWHNGNVIYTDDFSSGINWSVMPVIGGNEGVFTSASYMTVNPFGANVSGSVKFDAKASLTLNEFELSSLSFAQKTDDTETDSTIRISFYPKASKTKTFYQNGVNMGSKVAAFIDADDTWHTYEIKLTTSDLIIYRDGDLWDQRSLDHSFVKMEGGLKIAPHTSGSITLRNLSIYGGPELPVITQHPVAPGGVIEGQTVNLTAAATNADSQQWYKDGIAIVGAETTNYSFQAQAGDDGAVYRIDFSNVGGTVSSNNTTINVEPLDTTAPTISIVLSGDEVQVTASDDIDTELDLQLVVDSVDTGPSQTSTTFDLTQYSWPTPPYNIQVRATDNQGNNTTSNTVVYSPATPLFTENFADGTNWSIAPSTANNEGTFTSSAHLTTNPFTTEQGGELRFDMKCPSTNSGTQSRNMYFTMTTAGGKVSSTVRLVWYSNATKTGAIYQGPTTNGALTPNNTLPAGFAFKDDAWHSYEFKIKTDNTFEIWVDGSNLYTGTLPDEVGTMNGGFRIEPSEGSVVFRNMNWYGL